MELRWQPVRRLFEAFGLQGSPMARTRCGARREWISVHTDSHPTTPNDGGWQGDTRTTRQTYVIEGAKVAFGAIQQVVLGKVLGSDGPT